MPNLRLMTYLPSFYVIVLIEPNTKGDHTDRTVSMHLVTYQGRVIAKESIDWEGTTTPQFKLISQLANDSIGKIKIKDIAVT